LAIIIALMLGQLNCTAALDVETTQHSPIVVVVENVPYGISVVAIGKCEYVILHTASGSSIVHKGRCDHNYEQLEDE